MIGWRGLPTLLAVMLVPAVAAQAPPVGEPTRILMVYAHDPNAPGVVAFGEQLKAVARGQIPTGVEIYDEYLDLDRFPYANRSAQLSRYFAEKYQGFRPDAIVAEGSQALRFATDRLTDLFPGVPIVYGNVFEPIVDFDALPANVTGRRQPLPFVETYSLARALQPDAERVVVLTGASAMDSAVLGVGLRQIRPLLGGMKLEVLRDWSYESLIATLRGLPPRTFVLFSSFRRDWRGQEFNSGDLIASLTRVASAPVYGIARNWVGDGVVGGGVLQFADDGMYTGRLLVRVLRRAPGEPMPPAEVGATPTVVDWRQLQRWGLLESRLPPGTQVLYRAPSTWERHRGTILGVLAIVGLQSLLIGRLLVERRRRMRAQRTVEDQLAYERMLAALTAETVRLPPAELIGALESALRRVGRFAGASAAILAVRPGEAEGVAPGLSWTAVDDRVEPVAETPDADRGDPGGIRLEIPLVVENVRYGSLELRRAAGGGWPAEMVARLEAAADLFAGVLARASAGRALEVARRQVQHLAQVATVSGLAAAVSHELRQPLTAIRMNAEAGALYLAQTPPEVNEARVIFQDIVRDDVRASEVIEEFRALLRKRDPISTTVDLNAICRHTARLLERETKGREAKLVLALSPALPAVRGDPVQLQQVVINLTLNALDAVAGSTQDRSVVLGTALADDTVELQVRDSGGGLPPEVRGRLFEPFFSTKPHGLGMGLTIVRTIVERHEGRLRAENGPAGGAVFTVTLPAEEGSAVEREEIGVDTALPLDPSRVG